MTELFNVSTRKKDVIDDEEGLHKALLEGTHSFKAGSQVTVTSPDGTRGTVPAESVNDAIGQGYRVETATAQAVREYVDANKGLGSALKVGLTQLADEAAMGLPELIFQKKGDPLEVAKREALKKEHELANTLGGITGFAGSLFLGGPLWKAGAKAGEKTAALVAEKLALQAGEEVGKRTLKAAAQDVLKTMAAKGAGTGVEGAVVSMPHMITEAALGDPEAAAETLLAGTGVGILFGAGGSLAKDFLKLGKESVVKGASLVTSQEETAKSLARKAANVLTGVGEDDILHYVQHADRVNAAPMREVIKDSIDAARSKYSAAVEVAKENVFKASKELDDAYQATRFDLTRTRPPESLADDILVALDAEKGNLGRFSEQADDVLEQSGRRTPKAQVLSFLDDVDSGLGIGQKGALVSDEAVSARNRIRAQRKRIEEGFGDELSATELRAVLKDMRKDIKWNQLSGEFNDTLNGARKKFTERISTVLKDVPGYAEVMQTMAQRSQALEKMSKAFGSKEKAVGSLNALLSPKGQIKDDLLREFSALTGQDFVSPLSDFKKAKELLELSRKGDARDGLLPELSAKKKVLEKALADAEAAYEPLRRLSPERTQSIIRNQGFKHASIEDRRALEELGSREGQNFLEMIQDRNVLDAFGKESITGSRKTLLGAVLGGMVGGGPIGSAVGGAIGATTDVYGGQILKRIIDSNRNVSGLLFAEKAMKEVADKLDTIPAMLRRMHEKAPIKPSGLATFGVLKAMSLSKDEEKAEGRAQRLRYLDEVREKATVLVSNGQASSSTIEGLSAALVNGGAPGIGSAYTGKMNQALSYFFSAMPKPPRPRSPFAPKVQWKPTDFELAAFEQKAQVIEAPLSVLDELEQGTLTRNHMDALKVVYPAVYEMIRSKVTLAVTEGVEPLDYNQRVKLSLLMDAPMDASLGAQSVAYYQQAFQNADQISDQVGQAMPAGQPMKVDLASQSLSDTEKLLNR